MKKVILAASFAVLGMVALSSCKKDRTCECTVLGQTADAETYLDSTKKDAEAKCDLLNAQAATFAGSCSLKK